MRFVKITLVRLQTVLLGKMAYITNNFATENTKQTLADLETLLKSDNIDPEEAKNLLIRLRYMNNVEGVCREWQPGKEIVLQH